MKTRLPLLWPMLAMAIATGTDAARAELPTAVVFGGAQAGPRNDFAYLGMVQPLPGAELGRGYYAKAILSRLSYRYDSSDSGPTTEVGARGPGIEIGAGHAWKHERSTFDLSATVGYRNLDVTPFVPSRQESGSVLTLNPQLSTLTRLTDTVSADLIANYAIGLGSSWARARVGAQPSGSWRAGIEAIFLDGRTYQTRQQGVFLSLPLDASSAVEISVGRSKPRDDAAGTYVAVGFSFTF